MMPFTYSEYTYSQSHVSQHQVTATHDSTYVSIKLQRAEAFHQPVLFIFLLKILHSEPSTLAKSRLLSAP
jgi:hypothetical protein